MGGVATVRDGKPESSGTPSQAGDPPESGGAATTALGIPEGGPALDNERARREGLSVLVSVYLVWAVIPLFWRQLDHVPPFEVLAHRSFWGFIFVFGMLVVQGRLKELAPIFRTKRTLFYMGGCSAVHVLSWGLFIWAISNGRLLESSLGSYILPMCSVLSGFFFFKERPRRVQWIAIAIAGIGVAGMVVRFGSLPWVALLTAGCSVFFTYCRKHVPEVGATPGLVADMLLSSPLLWGYLIWLHATGQGSLGHPDFTLAQDILLVGAGIVTMIPQLGFAFGLSRVPLTTLSLLQYLPPTGAFLIGAFIFGEPFGPDKVFGFVFIWAGLVIFTIEGYRYHRKHMRRFGI